VDPPGHGTGALVAVGACACQTAAPPARRRRRC
jgi:hypothetical protein